MLNPQHILITGASSGIGAALAELYAAPGRRLSLHGRDAQRLALVAAAVAQKGALVSITTGNVIDRAGMAAWIETCDRAQPLDLAIANAGVSAGTGGGGESPEQSRGIFAVNLGGVLNTVEPALALMQKRGRGQIAIVSSLAGFRGYHGAPAYGSSKAAVRIYGEALRDASAPQGIEVNVICPGFVKTPMTDVNHFPMPFIMSAERAARIVEKGLARNRARIAFPFAMYALIRLIAALPQGWTAKALARLPQKSRKS